jgi:hypothetical protein
MKEIFTAAVFGSNHGGNICLSRGFHSVHKFLKATNVTVKSKSVPLHAKERLEGEEL